MKTQQFPIIESFKFLQYILPLGSPLDSMAGNSSMFISIPFSTIWSSPHLHCPFFASTLNSSLQDQLLTESEDDNSSLVQYNISNPLKHDFIEYNIINIYSHFPLFLDRWWWTSKTHCPRRTSVLNWYLLYIRKSNSE